MLSLLMVGRAHAFQAIGLPLACAHPDAAQIESELGAAGDAHPAGDDHHCPPGCQRCPCGAMSAVPLLGLAPARALLSFLEIARSQIVILFSGDVRHRLDRPPRSARA